MKTNTQHDVAAAFNRGPSCLQIPKESRQEPPDGTPMVVALTELRSYENNPRTMQNPLFEEIKESIRQRGLDAPIPITRKPGDKFYITCAGGNTRLQAIQALAKEGDIRFLQIECIYRTWGGEIATLAGHVIENELRSPLSFIEKSIAVYKLKEMFEKELGEGVDLTPGDLSVLLKKEGLVIHKNHVGKMLGCYGYLYPALPTVLYKGLGRPTVERLLSLRHALVKVYLDANSSEDKDLATRRFDQIWFATLSNHDVDLSTFNEESIREELLFRMASDVGVEFTTLEIELQKNLGEPTARLPVSSVPLPIVTKTPETCGDQQVSVPNAKAKAGDEQSYVPQVEHPAISQDDGTDGGKTSTDQHSGAPASFAWETSRQAVSADRTQASLSEFSSQSEDADDEKPTSLPDVYAEMEELGHQLAKWAGVSDEVNVLQDEMGFALPELDSKNPRERTVLILLGEGFDALTGVSQTVSVVGEPHRYERVPDTLFEHYIRMIRNARQSRQQQGGES